MKIEPLTLNGRFVSLELMAIKHHSELCKIGLNADLWRWSPTEILSPEDMKNYIETALDEQANGQSLPFVTREKSSSKIVGSTRFGNIDVKNRRAEIGWTWINPMWQRTYVNTEAKLLMLTYAFEVWDCIRVELKTDALNAKSRNAILRLGATEEGIFRHHIICQDGRLRDTVYFSILKSEWNSVKENLIKKLGRNK
jgi:RimJ/RimL family protein N-acetyltransferase